MKKSRIIAAAALLLSAVQIVSCSGSYKSGEMDSMDFNSAYLYSEPMAVESFGTAYADDNGVYEEAYEETYESGSVNNDLSQRKIIKSASLQFQTQTYDDFVKAMEGCISSYGGYIESSEQYGNTIYSTNSSRSSYITARIPADNYERFMSDACNMGTLTYRSESSNDVTMNYVDVESHINALETEYDALIEILEKATSLDDVIQLQSRISEVNYQLDTYKSQLRKFDDLISYCTVRIDINEVYREVPLESSMTFGEKIKNGLEETFIDIGEDFSEFSIWFITSLPYIIIWAVIIAAAVIIIKKLYAKGKKKKEIRQIEKQLKQINENKNSNQENN